MSYKLFLSHDHRDDALAKVIASTLSRITLGQLEVWFSSDDSPSGGIKPGKVWIDEIRTQLGMSRAVIILLTPLSLTKPWLLFESGFGAAMQNCEVIPLCVGISTLRDVPFPLAMFQCFQLADYESLKSFISKLLQLYRINFDEEMANPVLRTAISAFTKSMSSSENGDDVQHKMSLPDFAEEIRQHIDRRFLEFVERQEALSNRSGAAIKEYSQTVYTVPIHVNFPELNSKQYLNIDNSLSVQDVMNKIYYMLEEVIPAFTYLETWILKETKKNIYLVMREVSGMVPAHFVFTATSEWEAIKLAVPYSSKDSSDIERWYYNKRWN